MTKDQLESKMNTLISKLDSTITSLKAIKNYRYDSMCTDFLRSMNNKRAEIYRDWEKFLGMDSASFASYDIEKYYQEKDKQLDGFHQTLLYLQSRKPIKNPYGNQRGTSLKLSKKSQIILQNNINEGSQPGEE